MNKPMLEQWTNKINVVESIRGGMTEDAKSTLAQVLTNTKNAVSDFKAIRNESVCRDTPASNLTSDTWFPDHVIDMVSAIYASQIIDDIVTVQPIDSPVGVVRYLQYVYGNSRGNVGRGELAIDEWGAMRGVDAGHRVTSELVESEAVGALGDSAVLSCFLQQLPIKADSDSFMVFENLTTPGKVKARPAAGADGWEVFKLTADNRLGEKITGADCRVNELSGEVKLSGVTGWAKDDDITVTYIQNLAVAPTDSMNLECRVKTEMIKAVPHKIRANFSFDASYALSKAHGVNVEESLVNAATATIRQERDNLVVDILMRQAGGHSTWDRTVKSYISQHEHDQSFISEIFACASKINYETKCGFGNWVVVGRQGLNIIKSAGAGMFKSAGATLPNNGAFVAGELDGGIKVIYSPYVAEDRYLVGYKGNDMSAGFIVADFLPITKTDLVMLDDFVGRQGLVSYYGTKMLNPNMYVEGRIVNGDLRDI